MLRALLALLALLVLALIAGPLAIASRESRREER